MTAGTINVTVTDANGCTANASTAITQPATAISATAAELKPVSCFGGSDGEAVVTPANGTTPYTYAWSAGTAGSTDSLRTALSAGLVTITVSDAVGCSTITSVTVTEPSAALTLGKTVLNQPLCSGNSNGSASVQASGGTSPYTFAWPAGVTTSPDSVANNLGGAATYIVTVTDSRGCNDTISIKLTDPLSVAAAFTFVQNPTCFGVSDGQVIVTPSGGTTPYTYAWIGGGSTGTPDSIRNNVAAGLLRAVLTDGNGCTDTADTTLVNPALLSASFTFTQNVPCKGDSSGIAIATPSGGTPGYTYAWTGAGITGTPDSIRNSLPAGSIQVQITDAKGCDTTISTIITEPASAMSVTVTVLEDIKCKGDTNGKASAIPANGTAPYTYTWSSGTTYTADSTHRGLSVGNVSVTVSDASGCIAIGHDTLTESTTALSAGFTATTNPSCAGATLGSTTVTPTGGDPGYTYAWSAGTAGGTDSIRNGLSAGVVLVSVTDSRGCQIVRSQNLTDPGLFTVASAVSHPVCNGDTNGSITVTPTGGTSPFTFSWSSGTAGSSDSIRLQLTAGIITVTITDSSGCSLVHADTLINPPAIAITTLTKTNVACFGGSTGIIQVSVANGTPGFTYTWSAGAQGSSVNERINLSAGAINLTVTDTLGCQGTFSDNITQPATGISAVVALKQHPICNGDANGQLIVTPSGGVAPYTYNWSSGTAGSTDSIRTGLSAGVISVTVSDTGSCSFVVTDTLTDPPVFGASFTVFNQPACFGQTGDAIATPSGGIAPYTYAWSGGTAGGTDSIRTGLTAGSISVTVTDQNGCQQVVTNTINVPTALSASFTAQQDVLCFGDTTGTVAITPVGGTPAYTYSWSGGTVGSTDSMRINLGASSLSVTITDANGCSTTSSTIITQPSSALSAVFTDTTNPTCSGGGLNGLAIITPAGGTPGYTYNWFGVGTAGSTDSIRTSLGAGQLIAEVTDANGCTSRDTVTLTNPTNLSASITSISHPSCAGGTDGQVIVTPTGGALPLSYTWSSGSTGGTDSIRTGLSAGTVSVTITDNLGCAANASTSLIDPPSLLASLTDSTSASCTGSTGSITVTPSGGTGAYTYSWPAGVTTGSTDSIAINLNPGSYTVTITDANGCTVTATKVLTSPACVVASITFSANTSCFGGNDGIAIVTPSSGTAPYTYTWPAGVTTSPDSVANNLMAGVPYIVTVSDATGASDTALALIGQPTTLTGSVVGFVSPGCVGSTNGRATVRGSGATPGYSYSWPAGVFTAGDSTAINLSGNLNYTVTITDSKLCTGTVIVNIPDPIALVLTFTDSTRITCNGNNNGSLTVTPSGGAAPYTYAWPAGVVTGGSDSIAVGLSANVNYTVTVTDSMGCNSTATSRLSEPTPIVNAGFNITKPSCGVNNGIVVAQISGGVPFASGYSYQWDSNGTVISAATNLINIYAGIYGLVVTDSLGCSANFSVTVNDSGASVVALNVLTPISCFDKCDAGISLTVSGDAPFSYQWSNGDTTRDITNLCEGNYAVQVTDNKGCRSFFNQSVAPGPVVFSIGFGVVPITCGTAFCDASITANPSSSGTFSYKWSRSASDINQTLNNACAGKYSITVTDGVGCKSIDSITIVNPTPVAFTITGTDADCFGSATGSATVTATAGTSPFTYTWSSGDTTSTANGLAKGTYYVTVTELGGCTKSDSVVIDEPAILSAVISTTKSACGDTTGTATVVASGGQGTYNYKWSTGATTSTPVITGLGAGFYNVEVIDPGCSRVFNFTISDTGAADIVLDTVVNERCSGTCDGAIFISVSGGTAPYNYSWSPGGMTNEDVTGLCQGTYSLTVTDFAGCKSVAFDTVKGPEPVISNITIAQNATGFGRCDGKAYVSATSPNSPLTYLWSNLQTGDTASSLCAGMSYVTITDKNGCQFKDSVLITAPGRLVVTNSVQNAPLCNKCDGEINVVIAGGVPPYTYLWDNGSLTDTSRNRCAGIAFLTVTDVNGNTEVFNFGLANSNGPLVSAAKTDPKCTNTCDGTASATASSGLTPYTYSWPSVGGTSMNIANLCPGTYYVEVKDKIGCVGVDSVILVEPSAISNSFSTTAPSCGIANGLVRSLPGGGTPSYAYSWLDGVKVPIVPAQTGDRLINISAGLYHVEITDGNGCKDTFAIALNNPGGATIQLDSIQNATCAGICDGVLRVHTSGSPVKSINWLPGGQGDSLITGLCAGSYTIEVTDTSNCKVLANYNISAPAAFDLVFASVTNTTCENTNDGALKVLAVGSSSYSYNWTGPDTFVATGSDLKNIVAGTYRVTATDSRGCIDSNSAQVSTNIVYSLTSSKDTALCINNAELEISVIVDATGFYSTTWYTLTGGLLGRQDTLKVRPGSGTTSYLAEVRQDICVKYDTVSVRVADPISVDAGPDKVMVVGQQVVLGGNPIASEGVTLTWTPTEGINTTDPLKPIASPAETTVYVLTGSNEAGCVAQDTVKVEVTDRIKVNDGFTPNGDGVNDSWEIGILQDFPNAKVEIYNRWGQLLYSSDPYVPWDGTYNGAPVPLGTYYYIINLNDTRLSEQTLTGPVTIIR
jgi:gliding motility-associated-like protein